MNKRFKIMCLSVLSLSLLSGTQVQAWPSFKKSAGCAVIAAGVAYVLWVKKDSIKNSVQRWISKKTTKLKGLIGNKTHSIFPEKKSEKASPKRTIDSGQELNFDGSKESEVG